MSGIFNANAIDLANCAPTNKLPINPGACVNAMAFNCANCSLRVNSGNAFFNAASTTGTIFSMCALLANSGTTPPYFSCTV